MTFLGRIEGRIPVPTGGAAVSATNSGGGPSTCTVPAGNYYLTAASGISSIVTELQTQLNASRPNDWTVSLNTTTGIVTIDCADEPYELVWTSTVLRDLLGFTGNIASTSSPSVGTRQARFLWIPDCPPNSDIPRHALAPRMTDRHTTTGPTGIAISHVGNSMFKHPGWRYSHVARRRVFKGAEVVVNESWEAFLEDVAWGLGLSWSDSSALCQVYDASGALVGINADSGNGMNGWYLVGPGINSLRPKPASGQIDLWWRIDEFDLVSDG
jgi:hypothetical protein